MIYPQAGTGRHQTPVGSLLDKWVVAKMTLHCGSDKVVFTLMRLRWVAYEKTENAVEIYWDGLGRESVCRCELACERAPACGMLPVLTVVVRVVYRAAEQEAGGQWQGQAPVSGSEHLGDYGHPNIGRGPMGATAAAAIGWG